MAIGMLKLRNGSKGKGVAHFNYIMREDKYKPHAEKKESKFEKFENSGHGNMPDWAKDNPKIFWQEADKHERQNGRIYKEHIIALPRELNEEQRLALVNDWIKQEIGDKHPYSFAIHTPQGMDGKDQPHVHFMFSQRTHDGIERSPDQFFKRYNGKDPSKGGAKKANEAMTKTKSKEAVKEQRLRLGDHINKHLERAGSKSRVDMRNWKEKGLDQKPLNINYKEMKDPTVEKTYKAKFQIQAEQKEIVKERFQVMGFGQLNAIFKDLEIRIAKEQALKAQPNPKPAEPPQEQPKKSRLGQWGAYRERLTKEKEQEQQRQQQEQQKQQAEANRKAELIKAQLEKMGDMSKGEVKPTHYEKLQTLPAVELDKIKANHEQRAERLEQKAQHEPLTETELKEYSLSKKALNSLDRLQREREAERLRLEQERKAERKEQTPKSTPVTADKLERPAPKPTTPPPPLSREQIQAQRNDQLKQAWQTMKDFDKLVSDKAEILKNATVKSRTEKAELAQTALDDHEKNKPLLQIWKLGDWETKKTELENAKKSADLALAQATGDTEKLKGKNFEPIDYTAHAIERLDKDPATKAQHDKSEQAKAQAERILYEIADEKAQAHGADFHAKQGVTYSGKIVRVDDKGILQQTQQGIVYYPQNLDVKQDKGYNITPSGDHYKVQPQFEIHKHTKDPSQELDAGVRR